MTGYVQRNNEDKGITFPPSKELIRWIKYNSLALPA
jgi:hypothetical protein